MLNLNPAAAATAPQIGFLWSLLFSADGVNKGLLMSGMSVIGARAVSTYSSIQLEKAQLSESMGTMVYDMLGVGGGGELCWDC